MSDANPHSFPVLDQETIAELKDVMAQDFDDLVKTFVNDTTLYLNRIVVAVNDKNSESVRRIAHSLKSSSGSIGALRLSELARQLELLGLDGRIDEIAAVLKLTRRVVDETRTALQALLKNRKVTGKDLY